MPAQYVNTLLDAVKTVFISMLDMAVTFENPVSKNTHHPTYEISSMIQISGALDYWIVLSYSKKMAMAVASEMLYETFFTINDELIDAIGEITNMVTGVADTKLEIENIAYSLPMVFVDSNQIRYPENGFVFSMPCIMNAGTLEVDIAFPQDITT